jgi:hypothetical protein
VAGVRWFGEPFRAHRRRLSVSANLVPDNPVGTIGFAEYLTETE